MDSEAALDTFPVSTCLCVLHAVSSPLCRYDGDDQNPGGDKDRYAR